MAIHDLFRIWIWGYPRLETSKCCWTGCFQSLGKSPWKIAGNPMVYGKSHVKSWMPPRSTWQKRPCPVVEWPGMTSSPCSCCCPRFQGVVAPRRMGSAAAEPDSWEGKVLPPIPGGRYMGEDATRVGSTDINIQLCMCVYVLAFRFRYV